jgi:peptidoglycan-associated lipoprotein
METMSSKCNIRSIIMKKLFIVLLLILVVGCEKKYTRPSEEAAIPEKETKEEVMKGEEEEKVDEITYAREEEITEGELSAEEKATAVFMDVLFDFDKYNNRPDARPALVASFMSENKHLDIVLEGHSDERGTNEYNLALGERRAKSAKNYLVSLGVSQSRMMAITYGEEKPVCTEKYESCWEKNRRAHFVVVRQHR